MSDTVIKVENLSKKYIINHQRRGGYTTLRDDVTNGAKKWGRKILSPFTHTHQSTTEEFFALKDVSFEIKQGDRVGIIGRNGAGKSTLLKVLSRITEPTSGRIEIDGRVASLLEVGTGFHPELTGRENIYLNGAILGMAHKEIKRKFDEIVAFAEVEKFLDTPVKRFSSGMYVRLAFAVAAHLEPEILVVDEVLAVGDAQFQKKCLGKMEEVSSKEGRTVLFVSHNMSAIESLCNRGILLESGGLSSDSSTQETVKLYLENAYRLSKDISLAQRKDRGGSGRAKASSFRILDEERKEVTSLQSGKDYYFEIGYVNNTGERLNSIIVSLDFQDEKSIKVLMLRSNFSNSTLSLNPDTGKIICGIKNLPLANGAYRFSIFLSHADRETLDHVLDASSITVDGGDFFGTGSQGMPTHCKILTKSDWSSPA